MKKIGLLSIIATLTMVSFGQGKYGADSVKCVQNLSLYRDYYKQKLYDDAYNYWKVVYTICGSQTQVLIV